MKRLIGVLLLSLSGVAAAGPYVSLAIGERKEAYNVAVGWELLKFANGSIGPELEFISCGEQPEGYNNINRMGNINVVGHVRFNDKLSGFGKFGASTTRWSHNGTNDYEKPVDETWGWAASVGLETPLTEHINLFGQLTVFEYEQVNNPHTGGYTAAAVGLRFRF